ncbi:MAG: N-acetylmannosamine-6-phosphate 2-epimerase [Bacteroidetes bacterium]|nr:N-acetylmannosamine-6-phosphate 2-epimerase [Bacteroidota bacterium]
MMEYLNSIANVKNGLIVSCQFDADDPFNHPDYVSLFALSAQMGGAAGIRTEGKQNIAAVKSKVNLPVIGLIQSTYPDGSVLITGDLKDVDEIIQAGADMVALDATERIRPNGLTGFEFLRRVRVDHPGTLLLADVSTFEEGVQAAELGADLVSTTLSGYTPATAQKRSAGVDFDLIERLSSSLVVPVIAEGRILLPREAAHVFELGAYAVVVGAAITRPTVITQMFVHEIQLGFRGNEKKD